MIRWRSCGMFATATRRSFKAPTFACIAINLNKLQNSGLPLLRGKLSHLYRYLQLVSGWLHSFDFDVDLLCRSALLRVSHLGNSNKDQSAPAVGGGLSWYVTTVLSLTRAKLPKHSPVNPASGGQRPDDLQKGGPRWTWTLRSEPDD